MSSKVLVVGSGVIGKCHLSLVATGLDHVCVVPTSSLCSRSPMYGIVRTSHLVAMGTKPSKYRFADGAGTPTQKNTHMVRFVNGFVISPASLFPSSEWGGHLVLSAFRFSAITFVHEFSLISPYPPLHPSTCSMGAGGLWMPFHCDDARTDRWAFETLDELLTLDSRDHDKGLAGTSGACGKSLVEILPAISFKNNRVEAPGWAVKSESARLRFQSLTMDELYDESKSQNFRLPQKEAWEEAGYSHAWLFHAPIVNSPKMLMVRCNF